jgi:hypothetical protein
MFRTLLVILAFATANTSFAFAQATDTTTNEHRGISVLFEATIGRRLNRHLYPGVQNFRGQVSWELGPLFNRGEWAWGVAVMASADEEGARWGIRPRYRRWLEPGVALDLGVGMLIGGETGYAEQHYPGLSALIGLTFGNLLGVNLELQAISTSQEYSPLSLRAIAPGDRHKSVDFAWLLGAKLSGAGALVLTTAEVLALMVACSSYQGF